MMQLSVVMAHSIMWYDKYGYTILIPTYSGYTQDKNK